MILLTCASCQKKLSVNDELAGKQVRCPGCKAVMAVPTTVKAPTSVSAQHQEPQTISDSERPKPRRATDEVTQPPPSLSDATKDPDSPEPDHDSSLTDFLAPAQADDELGRLGGYRILKIVGHGGMGVIFEGEDSKLGRKVAIKAMLPHLAQSKGSQQRFLREARAAAALEHDHIVTIHHVGEDRGVPFIVMPLLKGEPLDRRLAREDNIPLAEILRIGREIAEGLAAAHAAGLVHRDIKPANIWLERSGEPRALATGGRVKILDFGLARIEVRQHGITQQGAIIGTPAYMAPEQGRGETVDARCDLWSLGVVLYRMCTGKLPFQGKDPVSTLLAVVSEVPLPPAKINTAVPAGLSDLVMHLLERDLAKRISSATAVVDTLRGLEPRVDATQQIPDAATRTSREKPNEATGIARQEQGRPVIAPGRSVSKRRRSIIAAAGALLVTVVAALFLFWPRPEIPETKDPKTKGLTDAYALSFTTAEGHVAIPTLAYNGGPITLEARVQPRSKELGVLFAGGGKGSVALFWGGIHGLGFSAGEAGKGYSADWGDWTGAEPVTYVAGVWDGKEISCFINGKLARKNKRQEYGKEFPGFFLGGLPGATGFDGIVTEVRISKVARYDGYFTPPQRFEADADTLALYRFDEGQGDVVKDTSGNSHHGKIVGAKWVKADGTPIPAPPAGNYPLTFDGKGFVRVDVNPAVQAKKFTVEAWAMAEGPGMAAEQAGNLYRNAIHSKAADGGALSLQYGQEKDGSWRWKWVAVKSQTWHNVVSKEICEFGKWAHVAGVYDGERLTLFINGREQGSNPTIGKDLNFEVAPFQMGDLGGTRGTFVGKISAWRLSKTARYDKDFTPAKRFMSDADTLALYHFDEGQGDVLKDASSHGHDGKIVGAKWVNADGTPLGSSRKKFIRALGMEFALVPKGKAWLGGSGGQVGEREVEFKEDFYLGVYEVTQEEWEKVMGLKPSHFSHREEGKDAVKDFTDADLKRFPVENVTWTDARAFLAKLNEREQQPGWVYRLPTEAEWEYACRGGPLADKAESGFHYYFDKPTQQALAEQANFEHGKGLKRTCMVGSYPPNRLGLYDMHGNVWEWCADVLPPPPKGGARRVSRGGSWYSGPDNCQATSRLVIAPSTRLNDNGLRVARVLAGKD